MLKCQVCQKENPAGAEYCEDCGAALSAAAPIPVGAAAAGGGSSAASTTGASGPAETANPAGSIGSLSPVEPAPASPAAPPSSDDAPPDVASSSDLVTPGAALNSQPQAPTGEASSSAAASGSGPAAGATGAQTQARLLAVRYGAPTGDEIPLIGQRLVVGRFDPETGPVDVDLSESAESGHISRQHGELYREGDGSWMVRDLGSTNGVFVKGGDTASFGPRITAPRALKDGDELAFGNARFIFRAT